MPAGVPLTGPLAPIALPYPARAMSTRMLMFMSKVDAGWHAVLLATSLMRCVSNVASWSVAFPR